MLGKDLWQRIAIELQSAGYLCRRKVNGHGGQWSWHITFNPVPTAVTVAGLAGYGSANDGSARDGPAEDGQPGHKEIPSLELPTKKITRTTTTTTRESATPRAENRRRDLKQERVDALHYPEVTSKERAELERLIAFCVAESRQNVLDEVEGIRQAGGIKRGVVALASVLIEKVAAGDFNLSAGHKVQMQREARRQHATALKLAARTPAQFPMSEEMLAMLPPNMRRSAQASMSKHCSAELSHLDCQESSRERSAE